MFIIGVQGRELTCNFPRGPVAQVSAWHTDAFLCAAARAHDETWLDLFKASVHKDDRRFDGDKKLWLLTWWGFDELLHHCGALVAPLPLAVLDARYPAKQRA